MNSKHLKKIINKQFKICKKPLTYNDVSDGKMPEWFRKHTCSAAENQKWKEWTQKYLRDKMKMTKDRAFIEMSYIDVTYGLKLDGGQKRELERSK